MPILEKDGEERTKEEIVKVSKALSEVEFISHFVSVLGFSFLPQFARTLELKQFNNEE